ncbi:unnamed protein product [Gordionus sp. m RMFG-2023]
MLLGLSGAGKTYFFTLLLHNKQKITYTSIKENKGIYIANNKQILDIIDIPGFEAITYPLIDKYKSSALGVIFFIDSSQFSKNYRDVANYLYNIIHDKVIYTNQIPFLIICHKQDSPLAKNSTAIRTTLETEFEILKRTNQGNLSHPRALFYKHTDIFSFDKIKNKIEFVELNNDPVLDNLKAINWLNNL